MSADEKGTLLRLIPEFHYDAIARLPAGAGAILFAGVALGVFSNWFAEIRLLPGPAVTLWLVILLFATYTLGVLLSGAATVIAVPIRCLAWKLVRWWSSDYVDTGFQGSINREERKRYAEQKSEKPVLSKQRAEMALTTNLLTAAIASMGLGLWACTLTGWNYWLAGIVTLLVATFSRTYTYLEALMKPPPAGETASSPGAASAGASTEAR
jgi:hypothetical protein